jgi:hypothetical protein
MGGGVAWCCGGVYKARKCPEGVIEMRNLIREINYETPPPPPGEPLGELAYVEQQWVRPDTGRSAGIHKLFVNYGEWQGILAAFSVPFELISPMKWQKRLGFTMPQDYRERKKAIKAWVQARHPELKVTDATADAVAICEVMRE